MLSQRKSVKSRGQFVSAGEAEIQPSTIFNSSGVATVGARKERSVSALFRARCNTSNCYDFEVVVSSVHTAFSLTT